MSLHVVAVADLARPLAAECAAIGEIAQLDAYDVRLRLGGLLPAVVFQTADAHAAHGVLERLRRRGHGALALDLAEVTPSASMVRLGRFAIEGANLRSGDRGETVPLASLTALVQAATSTDILRTTREREPAYAAARFAPTTSDVERLSHDVATEQMLFLFRSGGPPWLLSERDAKYTGLGAALQPTRRQNFRATIALLRGAAPGACFDDRFAAEPHTSGKLVMAHGSDHPNPRGDDRLDVLVHLVARWLTRPVGGPYRAAAERPD